LELLQNHFKVEIGKGVELSDGTEYVLITYGLVMLSNSVNVAKNLMQKFNIKIKVINMPWLNKFDHNWLLSRLQLCTHLVLMDNHIKSGGQGEKILGLLAHHGLRIRNVMHIGIDGVPICGTNDEVLDFYEMSEGKLENKLLRFIEASNA
jgi:transketolase C-terminal domain/subunit